MPCCRVLVFMFDPLNILFIRQREGERERRERERERERELERQRQTQRQKYRDTERDTDRQTEKHRKGKNQNVCMRLPLSVIMRACLHNDKY